MYILAVQQQLQSIKTLLVCVCCLRLDFKCRNHRQQMLHIIYKVVVLIGKVLLLDCRKIHFTRVSTRKSLLSEEAVHLINGQVATGNDTLLHLN